MCGAAKGRDEVACRRVIFYRIGRFVVGVDFTFFRHKTKTRRNEKKPKRRDSSRKGEEAICKKKLSCYYLSWSRGNESVFMSVVLYERLNPRPCVNKKKFLFFSFCSQQFFFVRHRVLGIRDWHYEYNNPFSQRQQPA